MFDISWTELLVIGAVALLVVGPKELPALLRTIGRYSGMIKRQANEFRSQFDEAMRETELEQLRRDVEKIKSEAESTLREAERAVDREVTENRRELDSAAAKPGRSDTEPVTVVEPGSGDRSPASPESPAPLPGTGDDRVSPAKTGA
jgi:sec-independent protein translocase protein TatB